MRALDAGLGEKFLYVTHCQGMSYVVWLRRDMARYVSVGHACSVANGEASTPDVIPTERHAIAVRSAR